jgi:signal transduction histidine kinase/DNA-binding NarL/FixJ family response regulator/HPt (histidine-containing phosphotransfer) domain-containing protein
MGGQLTTPPFSISFVPIGMNGNMAEPPDTNSPKKQTVRHVVFFIFCALAILASSGAAFIIYSLYDQYIVRQYERTLHQLSRFIQNEFPVLEDPDEVLRLLTEDDERYWDMQLTLTNLKNVYEVVYIYVLHKAGDGRWYFLVSSLYGRGTPVTEIHDLLLVPNNYLEQAVETGRLVVTGAPLSDEWGAFITSYLPVVVDGETRAVIGADYDISYIRGLHSEARIGLVISFVSALALSLLFTALARNVVTELERIVDERTKDLQIQTEIARNASAAKSRFLASMSHEIRTPMNAIIGMSTLMRTDNLDNLQRSYFTDIKKMSASLLRIINDILDISKIEAGKMEIIPVDFNLYELFDQICSTGQFSAASKSLLFNGDFDADVPKIVFGDEVRIRQVLTNLANNAIKYTKEGFVYLRVSRTVINNKEHLLFLAADSGIGIEEENLGKLFETFQQFDTRQNRGIVGTGLGLAITKQLVTMMGGKITVQSVYGEGSRFRVFLPLIPGDETAIPHAAALPRILAAPETRVLVVDDNAINLTVALGFLATHKIHAETALSGPEAIEKIRQNHFHLVFMDHMMPGMDGTEAASHIRALSNDWCKTMPIIALSANAQQGARELFLESGMNDFIPKPIEARDMNAALLKWLPAHLIAGRVVESSDTEESSGRLSDIMSPVSAALSASESASAVNDAGMAAGVSGADDLSLVFEKLKEISGLDVQAGIAYAGGGPKEYLSILRIFIAEADDYVSELRGFLAVEDWRLYKVKSHALKGIFAAIGFEGLSIEARRLEEASASGNHAFCRAETDGFLEKVLSFKGVLKGAIETDGEGGVVRRRSPVSAQLLSGTLSQFIAAAEAGRGRDAGAFAERIALFSFNDAVDVLLDEVVTLSASMDYNMAVDPAREVLRLLDTSKNGGS